MLSVLAVTIVGGVVVAGAQSNDSASSENSGKQASGERGGASSDTLVFCDGGAQEGVVQNIQDAPASKGEGGFTTLPSSALPVSVPAGDTDVFTITLTGEASMTGASVNDRIEVQALIDGVLIEPTPGPVGFHSGPFQDANSAMWCKRLGAGSHTATIQWRVLDFSPFATVTGFLDDYVVRAERSN